MIRVAFAMNNINQFLENNTKRMLEISSDIWVKRVYTENGIFFECEKTEKGKDTTLSTYRKKSDVLEWYKKL